MELIVARQTGEMHDVVRRMAAAGHFDTPPADVLEVIEETAHIGTGHLVARRVSHNGGTAGTKGKRALALVAVVLVVPTLRTYCREASLRGS